jgi:hypothetical protein
MAWAHRTVLIALAGILGCGLATRAEAQSSAGPADLNGVWATIRGGRGLAPELAPSPAGPIVLRPEYQAQYDARRQADAEAAARGEPRLAVETFCTPYGVPTMMAVALYPIEIIQTSDQVTIIAEAFSEVRRIYLDEPQLEFGEYPPGYYGHSVGHWEGDTLVVDTIAIKENVRGYQGVPHSDEMRVTERIRLVAPDILHDEIRIEDPVVLAEPVTYTLAYRRLPDYKMVEFVCENNREYVDDDGVIRMRLGQP